MPSILSQNPLRSGWAEGWCGPWFAHDRYDLNQEYVKPWTRGATLRGSLALGDSMLESARAVVVRWQEGFCTARKEGPVLETLVLKFLPSCL